MPDATLPPEMRCRLQHKLFTTLKNPVFRRSDVDGAPVIVIHLGEKEAAVPLPSLGREFGIEENSPDGRMLALIAQALDFVSALSPGDKLPSEILTGEASWQPEPAHFQLAATRVRLQLVEWLKSGARGEERSLDAGSLLQVADGPGLRAQVQEALSRAAIALALPTAAIVLDLLERLGRELAYIEALRDRLLRRLRVVVAKVHTLFHGFRGDATQIERITQVRRLFTIALNQISTRFEELDARTGEVMSALRNIDKQQVFIRSHRDWLYRSQRAWEPILVQWEAASEELDFALFALLGRTYQFLAPRFMPVTEWLSTSRQGRAFRSNGAQRMIW